MVKSFKSLETPRVDGKSLMNSRERAIVVLLTDGTSEIHRIGVYEGRENAGTWQPQINKRLQNTNESPVIKFYHDAELRAVASVAMRWFKAIAYASAIRDLELAPQRIALAAAIRLREHGYLSELMQDMAAFDAPTTYGLIVRFAIEGVIELDLRQKGLCDTTSWSANVVT